MKNSKILIIFVVIILMIGLSSCKRASSDDPTMQVNSGFRVILSGVANPSTLYVPDDNGAFSTNLIIQAKDNKGNPLVGYQVILEQLGPFYGLFEDDMITVSKRTDSNGNIFVNYAFLEGIYVATSQYIEVRATLVDDGRIDPKDTSAAINDIIPIKIVNNENNIYEDFYLLHGEVSLKDGTGVSGVTITITNYGSTGTYSFTNRQSGSFEIMLPRGWTGTITPSKSGTIFFPARRRISIPMSGNLMWEDFKASN
jgi:hypothetical protein